MTHRIAFSLAAILAILIAADLLAGGGAVLFVARRFADLVQALAVWR